MSADGTEMRGPGQAAPLLRLEQVAKTFRRPDGSLVQSVAGVDLEVRAEETLALVGESGSGKSTLARIALGLQRPDTGRVWVGGQDVSALDQGAMRRRMLQIQPVFQDSSAAFNPRLRIGDALLQADALAGGPADQAEARISALLQQVGLSGGREFRQRYPHEVSGGQRQRLAIARALATGAALIVADEPLSGADVSIRGQILNLFIQLRRSRRIALLFITHDISIARAFADRVAVMYKGEIIEHGPAEAVLAAPREEYTRRLVAAVPALPPVVRPWLPPPGQPSASRPSRAALTRLPDIAPLPPP